MNRPFLQLFILMIFLGIFSADSFATGFTPDSTDSVSHDRESPRAFSDKQDELSFWAGYAFDSYRLWGTTPDATIQSYGLQYNRKLFKVKGGQLEYNLQVSAYSKFSYPEFRIGRPRNDLNGVGITPIGFQFNFLSEQRVQPFINSSGGLIFLDDPFPDWRGKKTNFSFSIGSGMEFMLSKSVSLTVGMKYHHISNGDMGQVNPGIDSNVFYSAITIF